MKLFLSVSPTPDADRREALLAAVISAVPDSTAHFESDGSTLCIEVMEHADRFVVLDAVTQRLGDFGYKVSEAATGGATVPPIINLPPLGGEKQPKTVRMSTLVALLVAFTLVFSVLAFSLGSLLTSLGLWGNSATLGVDGTEGYRGKISLIDTIFSEYAIYDANGDLLLDRMLEAYVDATGDPYAAYYTAEEFVHYTTQSNGTVIGVGISIAPSEEPAGIAIIDVLPSSPAEQAGVRPGDVIVTVGKGDNAISVADRGYKTSSDALRGVEGTVCEFTVLREEQSIAFSIARAKLDILSVTGKVSESDPTVGIVAISQFLFNTPEQFKAQMDRLIGLGCTRFVFDVRNNPGGDIKSVSALLSYFLNENDLITTIVRKDGATESLCVEPVTYEGNDALCSVAVDEIGKYRHMKIAVLINGNTVSAAELFAAVLRDYQLATLVGTTTYGKGVLQNVFDLSAFGYTGGLKLTTGYYNPPSGENYDGKGVAPSGAQTPLDDAVKDKNLALLTESEDNQLQAAIAAITQ